jgi:uncharacterized protein (TIGR02594 family)
MAPSWLAWMRAHNGVHEAPGTDSHPLIIEALLTCDNLGEWAKNRDETAWCAAIVNLALEKSGFVSTRHALASSYLSYGMELVSPWLGCITVIKRRGGGSDAATGSRTGYHVSLFEEAAEGGLWLLGGNQSNQIKVSFYPRQRYEVLGYRWPVLRV